jgi:hypothetical protein
MVRLRQQRQVDGFEVQQLDVEPSVLTGSIDEPVGNRTANAAFTYACDDDAKARTLAHAHSPFMLYANR